MLQPAPEDSQASGMGKQRGLGQRDPLEAGGEWKWDSALRGGLGRLADWGSFPNLPQRHSPGGFCFVMTWCIFFL